MSTTRDQQPYAEHTDRTSGGVQLFALHNLTADDIAQVLDAIRSRRMLQELRRQQVPPPPHLVAQKIAIDASRLDMISTALQNTRHHDAALVG